MPTPRERVARTIRGEGTDRSARGEFFIADEFARAFLSAPEGVQPPQSIDFRHHRSLVERLDLDIASVAFSTGWGALQQPDTDRGLDWLARWHAESDRFLFALIDGPFSAAVQARGFNMLMHCARGAPHLARDLFRRGAEEARGIARAVCDAGADGVILGEDIAYSRATYLSPSDLRALYLPALRQVVSEIRNLGLAVFFHSDGNLNAVMDDIAACGLDGIQGLEPEAGMAIGAAQARVGNALTLWGNLGFEFLSRPRTDSEIDQVVCPLVAPSVERNRYIFGTCGGLVPGMNIETVKRVYDRVARTG